MSVIVGMRRTPCSNRRRAVPREIVHRARASPSGVARRARRSDSRRPTATDRTVVCARSHDVFIVFITEHPRTGVACAPIFMTPNVRTRDVIRAAADKARAEAIATRDASSHRRARPPDDRTETHTRAHTSLIMHASQLAHTARIATTTSRSTASRSRRARRWARRRRR